MLLLSNRATIRQVDLITNEYKPLITQLDSAVAMDFLVRNNTLIWSDVAQEKIMMSVWFLKEFLRFEERKGTI